MSIAYFPILFLLIQSKYITEIIVVVDKIKDSGQRVLDLTLVLSPTVHEQR